MSAEFPGTSWSDVIDSGLKAAGEGAVTGALTGCAIGIVGAGISCVPVALAGAVAGAIGGAIGGALDSIIDQNSYSADQIYDFEHAALSLIFADTYEYLPPTYPGCSQGDNGTKVDVTCLEGTVIQYTALFLTVHKALAGLGLGTALIQADGQLKAFLDAGSQGGDLGNIATGTDSVYVKPGPGNTCSSEIGGGSYA